jgi:putative drug exporter of the RND superfamily
MSTTTSTPSRPSLLARVARFAVAHRRAVLIGWVVVVVAAIFVSSTVGTRYASNFSLPGTESQRATDLLTRDFPAQAGDTDQIVLKARTGRVTDPSVRARVTPMLARVAKLPHVTGVVSPYSREGARAVSSNGRIAFATVTFDKRANDLPKPAIRRVISVAQDARSPQLQVELGGQAIQQAQELSLGAPTAIGIAAAIVVLLITFGSFVAMGLPIVTALIGLGTGVGLIGLGSQLIDMPDFSTELAVMIGLGVGIDYSLFIVTRYRENFAKGMGVTEATVAAMDTAGRAVLFAGITVIIALLGMFALGVSFLYGVAVSSALGVLLVMLASLTVLPALISKFGERLGRPGRFSRRRRAAASDPGRLTGWGRWAQWVAGHPWPSVVAGLAIMLVLAVPALSMRAGASDAGNDPTSLTTRRAYDLLAEGFGKGFNGPLVVAAQLPRAGDGAALTRIAGTLGATSDVASVSPPQVSPRGTTAVFMVYPRSAPQSEATTDLVTRLRDTTIPPAARATGAAVLVGGAMAAQVDVTRVLSDKLPLFIGVVVLLSAVLLLVVFRSLLIPVQAAAMNLLSIGASLGVVVAVFQWGWLGGLFGVEAGPIDAFIPVMLFAIVFGLSMDYEVFLISRIHEEWVRRRDASRAVVSGLASTGRVITAAATIMVCVFLSFVLGDQRALKMFGLSLASAVFLDAFVVRSLLLPAVLELLGRATWRLPRWLDRRLPHLAIDPPSVESGAERPRQPAEPALSET